MQCILFLACRMRALQITGDKGHPPNWAERSMYGCVLATCVQVVTCVVLPLMTEGVSRVDNDGCVTYDLRPMLGAYAITVVKYFSLFLLHGGTIAVSISVLTMTPETCTHEAEPIDFDTAWCIFEALLWTGLLMAIACVLSSAKVIGLAVKCALQSVPKSHIGTQITVENAILSLHGYVNIKNLVVSNPLITKDKWSSPFLLKAGQCCLDIDLWRLIRTFGKEFEITELTLHDIEFCFEKHGYSKGSNVHEVIDHMEAHKAQVARTNKERAAASKKDASKVVGQGDHKPEQNASTHHVTLHKLSVKDIQATVFSSFGEIMTLQVGTVEHEDFQKEAAGHDTQMLSEDLVKILLKTLCKTMIGNSEIIGKAITGLAKQQASRLAVGCEPFGRLVSPSST